MHSLAKRMTLPKLLAGIAVILLASTAFGAAAQPVKIGHLAIVADAPFYLAIEDGYFKQEGVEVELERFNSAAQAVKRAQISFQRTEPCKWTSLARGRELGPRKSELAVATNRSRARRNSA